jgi:peptidoglycan/LPS O-acetylase OafA/YrhL
LILFARRLGVLPDAYLPRLLLMLGPVLLVAATSWYLVERPLIAWAGRSRGSDERRASGARDRGESRRRAQLEAHAAP